VEDLEKVLNHNTQLYQNVFAGIDAAHHVFQEVLNIMVRGEHPVVLESKDADFEFYFNKYIAGVKAAEEAKAAEAVAPPAEELPAGVTIFGGDNG
jgi:hypothetical protein